MKYPRKAASSMLIALSSVIVLAPTDTTAFVVTHHSAKLLPNLHKKESFKFHPLNSCHKHRQSIPHMLAPEEQTETSYDNPIISHFTNGRAVTAGILLATTLFLFPLHAQAGFGPSGAATTTPAPVSKVNVNDLSGKKLQQLIDSSLDENRLNDFQSQLDALIEGISKGLGNQGQIEAPSDADTEAAEKYQQLLESNAAGEQRLATAKDFQEQIQRRERLLDRLEAQPWWFNYLAAFVGSVASTCVMHPVDTIKTRLQARGYDETDSTEGMFTNLYEGLTGNILKEGPPFAFYLGVYESVKSSLLKGALSPAWASLWGVSSSSAAAAVTGGNPTYLLSIYLTAGAAGELLGSTARAPAEAVKNLVQTQAASTATEAFQLAMGSPESRQNVFRAWSASLLRDVPFGAIQLALFELIKSYILNNPNIDFDTSTLQAEAVIGTISGGIGAFITNPSDVIVTRIITQSIGDDEEPLGVFEMGRLIFQEGGIASFFTGWQARVLYWAPAISIFLTCYCSVRQLGIKLDLFG